MSVALHCFQHDFGKSPFHTPQIHLQSLRTYRVGCDPWGYRDSGHCVVFHVDSSAYQPPENDSLINIPLSTEKGDEYTPRHGDIIDFDGARGSSYYFLEQDSPLSNSFRVHRGMTEYGYWVPPHFSDAPFLYYSDTESFVRVMWEVTGRVSTSAEVREYFHKLTAAQRQKPSVGEEPKRMSDLVFLFHPVKGYEDLAELLPGSLSVSVALKEAERERVARVLPRRREWMIAFTSSLLAVCLALPRGVSTLIARYLILGSPSPSPSLSSSYSASKSHRLGLSKAEIDQLRYESVYDAKERGTLVFPKESFVSLSEEAKAAYRDSMMKYPRAGWHAMASFFVAH
jgi:hypothetical protein